MNQENIAETLNSENTQEAPQVESENSTPNQKEVPPKGYVPHEALKEARMEIKEKNEKLAEFEKLEKSRKEKEMKEKGKYKELLDTKSKELEEIMAKYQKAEEDNTRYVEYQQSLLEREMSSLEEDDKSVLEELLEGKSIYEKLQILPKLKERFGTSKNIGSTINLPNKKDVPQVDKLKEAVKSGDVMAAIRNARNL